MEAESHSVIEMTVTLRISESEARAMDALVGYGADPFLEVFYKHLGSHYMKPHEAGLRSLFESVRKVIPLHIKKVDEARRAFNDPFGKRFKSPDTTTQEGREKA